MVDSHLLEAIDILHASIHRRQELRGIEPPESGLSNLEQSSSELPGSWALLILLAKSLRPWYDASAYVMVLWIDLEVSQASPDAD